MTLMLPGTSAKFETDIYLRNTENPHKFTHYAIKQVNKMSNKVHSKVKHNSLEQFKIFWNPAITRVLTEELHANLVTLYLSI